MIHAAGVAAACFVGAHVGASVGASVGAAVGAAVAASVSVCGAPVPKIHFSCRHRSGGTLNRNRVGRRSTDHAVVALVVGARVLLGTVTSPTASSTSTFSNDAGILPGHQHGSCCGPTASLERRRHPEHPQLGRRSSLLGRSACGSTGCRSSRRIRGCRGGASVGIAGVTKVC